MKNFKILALALTATLSLSSCDKDDDNPVVIEEEVITTVTTTFLADGKPTVTLTSRDRDGDGPQPPERIISGPLRPDTEYRGLVRFLDETKATPKDITPEIAVLAREHQVFYRATPTALGAFTYAGGADNDANGKPTGLGFRLRTGAVGTAGDIVLTLRHLPNKSADGVAAGNITNAGGTTDIEVTYPVTIAN